MTSLEELLEQADDVTDEVRDNGLIDDLAERLRSIRIVAEYWHGAAVRNLDNPGQMWTIAGHSLACVLSAIDGETDPAMLGMSDSIQK